MVQNPFLEAMATGADSPTQQITDLIGVATKPLPMKKHVTLSDEERALLKRWRPFYEELASGARAPSTVEQEHFVKVSRGLAVAETPHEKAYAKCLRVEASERQEEGEASRDAPAFDDRVPQGDWFTDDDYRKMHPGRRR